MSVVVWRKGREKQAEVSSCRTDKVGSLKEGRSCWASGDSGEGLARAEAERGHMRHVSAVANGPTRMYRWLMWRSPRRQGE